MDDRQWSLVGILTKTQGKDGDLLLKVKNDFPADHDTEEPVFIPIEGDDEPVPFFLTHMQRIGASRYSVHFDLVDDLKRAERLKGYGIYLPTERMEGVVEDPSWEFHVQGYEVVDEEQGKIGTIQEVIGDERNPVALVQGENGETPIPLNEGLIIDRDEEKKELTVRLPEGLIGLND